MKKLKIYVGCALKFAPEEFRQEIELFKQVLKERINCEILEFLVDEKATDEDVYHNDISHCVASADVIIAELSYASTGLGYEIATAIELHNKPVIGLVSMDRPSPSRLITRIPKNFTLDIYMNLSNMISLVEKRLTEIQSNSGKLIVIDGTDGSGKATQVRELVNRFTQEGSQVRTLDFPQYTEFFGSLIGECLAGKHGDFAQLSPKIASALYAADRFDASSKIKQWLDSGHVVILDRYVSANQIHQGGKIKDEVERQEFLKWLDHMEHGIFNIPRPDLIIYLDVPIEVTQRLLKEKSANTKKIYKDTVDLHEDNLEHLSAAKESGLKMISSGNNWHRVQCYEDGSLLSISTIHERIWEICQTY